MVLMTSPKLVSNYPPSVWRLTQSVYDCTFSASVRHSNSLVRALYIKVHEVATSVQNSGSFALIPPPPNGLPPVPPVIYTDASTSSQICVYCGALQSRLIENNYIALVMINGRQNQGPLYDANGNLILLLLGQIPISLIILVGWPHGMKTNKKPVYVLWSTVGATRDFYNEHFSHPTISEEEMKSGCILSLYTWTDISYSGKNYYEEEFNEGKMVTATGFSASFGSLKDLPVANFLYSFNKEDGNTIFWDITIPFIWVRTWRTH